MARNRSLPSDLWVIEAFADVSFGARLAYLGMGNFADDRGVHPAKVRTLRAEVFALDDVTTGEVAEFIAELLKAKLITEFEADGERYWVITDWARMQRIDKPSFKHPAPPTHNQKAPPSSRSGAEGSATPMSPVAEESANAPNTSKSIPGALVEDSATTPPEVKEGNKGRVVDEGSPNARPEDDPIPVAELLLADGSAYPVMPGKLATWTATFPGVDVAQQVREMAAWCIAHPKQRKTPRGVEAFVTGWLGRERDKVEARGGTVDAFAGDA